MDLFFEARVMHNPALGALLAWRFARTFFDATGRVRGPELPYALLVLPMAFHRRTVAKTCRMQIASGLMKAVVDEPQIRVGLQQRLQVFAEPTLSSINVACAAMLLSLERTEGWPRLLPAASPSGIPKELAPVTDDVKDMLKTVERLGAWFAQTDLSTLCSLLAVRF